MMRRRIFMWMGLVVLFSSFIFCQESLAKDQYKVKRGDTLAKISQKVNVSIPDLQAANGLQGSSLKSGQVLRIPKTGQAKLAKASKTAKTGKIQTATKKTGAAHLYVVKRGDSIYNIAKKTGISENEIKRLNHLRANRIKVGQKLALSQPKVIDDGKSARAKTVKNVALLDGDELEEADVSAPISEEDWAAVEKDKLASQELLGNWNNPTERQLLVKVAKGFMGAPYRLGGSSVRGLDCSAFVKKIYQFFDVTLPRTAHEQARVGMHVARSDLAEGDLVFFHTRSPIGHVGIYIGNNEFVHAASGRARMVKVSSLDEPYYNKRFVRAVRLKGLDGGV